MRRWLYIFAAVALVAIVVFDLEQARQQLAGAPEPLAALYEQPNTILDSGFDKRVKALEGHPIVINKWASWCRPCRAEFPIFQKVATDRGKEVAFVGVNAGDKRPAAEKFLDEHPLPYPSYEDTDEDIAEELKAAKFFPMTIFVDEKGKTAFVKAGEYTSTAELEADIDKYL
jgi:cytochrome c biogenesis protein CcmG, thiol:disulfide interchange protein DsbE